MKFGLRCHRPLVVILGLLHNGWRCMTSLPVALKYVTNCVTLRTCRFRPGASWLIAFLACLALVLLATGRIFPEVVPRSDLELVLKDLLRHDPRTGVLRVTVSFRPVTPGEADLCLNENLQTRDRISLREYRTFLKEKSVADVVKRRRCNVEAMPLIGRFIPELKSLRPSELIALFPMLRDGGHYVPKDCEAVEKTAIIIPYRDRWGNLHTLMLVLIAMLIRQNIDFTIFVVEQCRGTTYNKGLLFNAGYLEALKLDTYGCFILHDVDMIPLDDRNLYRCNKTSPLHLSTAVSKFNYSTLYSGLFGGVVSFTRQQFQTINGASNMYFGWGAEDDDLRDRILNRGLIPYHKSHKYGVYQMLPHDQVNGWAKNPKRFELFRKRHERQNIDGLTSAVYKVASIATFPLYTWITVQIDEGQVLKTVPEKFRSAPEGISQPEEYKMVEIPELPP
ncbi:beta-N-acetyl-D-glucosaminide beta-1,4-N-acetylglucosaminyl-transferase-like [Physella acuta]|uniref:beta-N-acetyl-D-glucosaminide beta-1,4-N-acetylglucosaminyl-transferase-like n=1 Tax=Physella acuta TaxID=109671 RepID=UPI0027DB444F|nr:beta-N-acetyl-D-glucosaminide beta-1,4-N-acetylglucosaminyl-transferase-like [Physella acuta]